MRRKLEYIEYIDSTFTIDEKGFGDKANEVYDRRKN